MKYLVKMIIIVIIVTCFLVLTGTIAIKTKDDEKISASITCSILYLISFILVRIAGHMSVIFDDGIPLGLKTLHFGGWACLLFGIFFLFAAMREKRIFYRRSYCDSSV